MVLNFIIACLPACLSHQQSPSTLPQAFVIVLDRRPHLLTPDNVQRTACVLIRWSFLWFSWDFHIWAAIDSSWQPLDDVPGLLFPRASEVTTVWRYRNLIIIIIIIIIISMMVARLERPRVVWTGASYLERPSCISAATGRRWLKYCTERRIPFVSNAAHRLVHVRWLQRTSIYLLTVK